MKNKLLIVILIMSVYACSNKPSDDDKTETNKNNQSSSAQQPDSQTKSSTDNKTDNKSAKKNDDKGKKKKRRGRNKDSKDEEIVIINVEASEAFTGDAISVFKTTTILEADLESAVTSKASGIVLKINKEVGDEVKQSEVLAVLESDTQQLRIDSANANYQKSLHNYDRAKVLLQKGLANKESVDNLKFDTLSLKTNLDQAKMDLEFTRIKAPISGIITKRNIKKGNLIQLNTEVYEIVNFDSLQAVINVPENQWNSFEKNLMATVTFDSFSQPVKGKIIRIDPIVDSTTGTFKAVIDLDESENKLRPGLFGKIEVILDQRQNTLLLTKNAVIREDQKAFVFTIEKDNKIKKTEVEIGYEMDENLEIISGLELGQKVVTTGKNNLSEDSLVEVIN